MRSYELPKLNFTVVLEPQADGGFTALVPALPEVVTEGGTEAEALKMAEEATRAVIEFRNDHGIPIPTDTSPTLHRISIDV